MTCLLTILWSGWDTDSAPTGGGMLIDGSVPKSTSTATFDGFGQLHPRRLTVLVHLFVTTVMHSVRLATL